MDPYGLALEAFDGIGRVRVPGPDEPPVDPAVTLPNGSEVDGPVGLKTVLTQDPEAFIDTLLEALFTYAVGRPPGLADRPHLVTARERARTEGYRFSSLVYGVLRTPAFTHRRLP